MMRPMTTRQRLAKLAPVARQFPGLGCKTVRDLERWVALELGSVDALDAWHKYGTSRTRAIAPATIYHILAGNLAVSGQHSLLCGLILGARNFLKLPSRGGEEIIRFAEALPAPLRERVSWHNEFQPDTLKQANAVIAYGRDETIAELRAKTSWHQRFLGYGLQVSAIWLGKLTRSRLTPKLAAAIAHDICIYDQMGCLSPQAIFLEPGSVTEEFCATLAKAMTAEIARQPRVIRTAEEFGVIFETLDTAQALGHRVWVASSATAATAGAIIHDPHAQFRFSCLHRVVRVHEVKPSQLPAALNMVRGKISTLGVTGTLTPALEKIFIDLGVNRFCPIGQMQHPPLSWHHDGRPSLSDLVRWSDS